MQAENSRRKKPEDHLKNNIQGISELTTPIYRLFEPKWLIDWLQTKRLGLVHPKKWDDPFENFFLNCKAKTPEGDLVSLDLIRDGWYGQCWTTKAESDAMWRIYSPEKNRIRVSTTVEKLFQSFFDDSDPLASLKFAIGRVRYLDASEIEGFLERESFSDLVLGGQLRGLASTLYMKRLEFSHEEEVRLLFHDADKEFAGLEVAPLNLDPSAVIQELMLDPRIADSDAASIQEQLGSVGFSGPVTRSDLYRFPARTIRL